MEFTSKQKAVLLLCFFMLSCLLLLPRASSAAPLSRSLSLTNRQLPTKNPALEVPAQQDQGAVEDGNLGEVAARMDIEVNDYPGSGANNRHEPRSPGRP
ncbi:hypothetical protein BDA96_03G360300 [Sorghum bicolor]|uniref:Uncharacterized protein n=2 Tax=Sorghum bicolor TaxID=4558 RepID=A0A921RGK8_SORBI|nr:uncharacterized protein LOC8085386 [Sorghum bicolor]EES03794.1 hypothetical protein SORBI_3003G334000 [Sorghum bicolor]KAG0539881.1 hypothetical protein BDA96_03G360300 [Sorghum bicolor]|eukprot:XP_002458674.1 uncharacterized protein LOC8085386 [Sorghum bicolor]